MSSINEVAQAYAEARSDAKRKHRLVALLSCIVVLAIAAALMAPAISATKETLELEGEQASVVATSEAQAEDAGSDEAAEDEVAASDDQAAADTDAADGDAGTGKQANDKGDAPAADNAADAEGSDTDENAAEESPMPAQTFTEEFKNKKDEVTFAVTIDAPDGALPEGTTMEAKKVKSNDVQDAVDQAVSEKTDGKAEVKKLEAVNIAFRDVDGNPVEPAADVAVTMSSAQLDTSDEDAPEPVVVTVPDEGDPAVVDQLTDEQLEEREQQLADNELAFDTASSSTYAIAYTDVQITKTVIDAKGDTWEIVVTCGEDAGIPADAELKVDELLPEADEYYEYYRQAADLVCAGSEEGSPHGYGRLFDISIWSGEEKIEPQSTVQVSIKLANAPEDSDELKVVHFGAREPEVLPAEETLEKEFITTDEQAEGKSAELRFETDSFSLYAIVSTNANNGFGLGGQKFAIINGSAKEAVLGRTNDRNRIAASSASVENIDGKNYVVADEVTLWEFVHVSDNAYNLKAPDGNYLNITGDGSAALTSDPQNITVTPSGNGLRLVAPNNYALNAWNSDVADGFGGGHWNDNAEHFTLYSVNELIQNQADKISLTDLVNLHNGETPISDVVIYTRIENQEKDGYDYYAVAADGSLTQVYDIGDTIGWVSSDKTPENLKWKLTVHYNGGEHNGYFDFQSMESGKYLIPTEASGLKDDDPADAWDLGVNMPGWRSGGGGTYGSSIERWDTGSREYVGYAYDATNKKIVPTANESQKLEFLFAHVKEDTAPNQLHEVTTLDGKTKGITIKMYDFDGSNLYTYGLPRSREMTEVLGGNSVASTNENGVGYAKKGLVSQTLSGGMPTAIETKRSLVDLFNGAHFKSDASNLFVRQVYDETGYFSYDSSKNYAYLDQSKNQGKGEFVLYRELAAPAMEGDTTPSANKGNFFPFDSLQDLANRNQVFTNRSVQYDGDLQKMSPDNPQYGETLYKIAHGNTNHYKSYFFGMTMEADFYQGPGGKDERGNDIIYEFNGDDDMWLYIDDRLVLDIGGCHGAVSGTINFATGVVKVNGARDQVTTTLREIFEDAGKLPDGTDWTTEGAAKWFKGNTFADYTKHSFKMFYLERGAYASNLKVNFNLMTIEPGSFVLEKKLPESVQSYGEQLFAYQIYTVSNGQSTLYTPPAGKQVTYEKSGEAIPVDQEGRGFKSTYTIGDKTYNNVYLLKPDEPIVIPTENNDVQYYVQEIGIPSVYGTVKANGQELTITDDREAATSTEAVKTRGRVTYENIPTETHNLRLEKLVQGQVLNPGDSFRFDVQLEDVATGALVPFNRGKYYVVKTNESGEDQYYKYVDGALVESTEPVAYYAGISGSIDRIFPGYTILIPGLLPGTDFLVTENQSAGEYPEGYQYVGKSVQNAGGAQVAGADGRILGKVEGEDYKDALVRITNATGTNVTLVKVDKDDLNAESPDCLKGASFTLSKYTNDTFQSKDTTWGDQGSKVLSDEKSGDTYTLNGVFEFEDLTPGYYKLEETVHPAGYVGLSEAPTFKVERDNSTSSGFKVTLINNPDNMLRVKDGGLIIVVGNEPGKPLPNTGGPGVTLVYALGTLMVLAAGGLLARRGWRCS